MDFFRNMFSAGQRIRIADDADMHEIEQPSPERWQQIVREYSEEGRMLDAQYGPITPEDFDKAYRSRTPAELAWDWEAQKKCVPWVIAAGAAGGLFGHFSSRMLLTRVRANRARALRMKLPPSPTVEKLSGWVDNPKQSSRLHLMHCVAFTFVGLNYMYWKMWPIYLEQVASMPNSKFALAVKRMQRDLELSSLRWDNIDDDDDVAGQPVEDSVFASKAQYTGQQVSAEAAAATGLSMGLTGGYQAGGSAEPEKK
eukprot:TRINITY_DN44138_c0_g1_i1.p1 TRINITY_DN44138_c0_g1~~TRINITY_DN44138_c0_g1_i1.p1  ORF type:complete len:255 (+),score=46.94 TRINITY_DN44138_c0_g1_i1:82-846(+)